MEVFSDDQDVQEEDQEEGIWEESFQKVFNNFLGFSVEGYKEEILKLMNSINARRQQIKGKGVQGTSKFEREIKKLKWTIQEKKSSSKGGSSEKGKGVFYG